MIDLSLCLACCFSKSLHGPLPVLPIVRSLLHKLALSPSRKPYHTSQVVVMGSSSVVSCVCFPGLYHCLPWLFLIVLLYWAAHFFQSHCPSCSCWFVELVYVPLHIILFRADI